MGVDVVPHGSFGTPQQSFCGDVVTAVVCDDDPVAVTVAVALFISIPAISIPLFLFANCFCAELAIRVHGQWSSASKLYLAQPRTHDYIRSP